MPIAEHKRDSPTMCLIFGGIIIDTVAGELHLPEEKLQRLRSLLRSWGDKKSLLPQRAGVTNQPSQPHLQVVRPGRSFLRRMLDLLHGTCTRPGSNDIIRLNTGFRADLAWWREFVSSWNGISFLAPPPHLPSVEITSDASGSWGCGAWHGDSWFQLPWRLILAARIH